MTHSKTAGTLMTYWGRQKGDSAENRRAFLRVLRLAGGTYKALATIAEVSDSAITKWAKNGCIPLSSLAMVSFKLGIPAAELRPDIARLFTTPPEELAPDAVARYGRSALPANPQEG